MRKEALVICCSASNHVNWLQVTLFIWRRVITYTHSNTKQSSIFR